jgi:ribonuclease BN (tRNA processing enzyme)
MMVARGPSADLTILGSGTCVPDRAHHSAAFHLDTGASAVLLDCGPGTLHGFDAYGVRWSELTHVVVSHFHTDHIGDLPALLFALKNAARPLRTTPLTLIGPVGLRAFLRGLADVLGEHLVSPGFDLRVVEVAPGTSFAESGGAFVLHACATPHTPESLAYRLSGAWGAVGYTGDSGPSEEVARFLAACDVLVGECGQSDPPRHDRHLSPALLADFAAVAQPGLLVVTHVYPPLSPDEAVGQVRERYRGVAVAGRDGMVVHIGAGEPPAVDPPRTARYT